MTMCKRDRMREGVIPGAGLAASRPSARRNFTAGLVPAFPRTPLATRADALSSSSNSVRARALNGPVRRDRRLAAAASITSNAGLSRVAAW